MWKAVALSIEEIRIDLAPPLRYSDSPALASAVRKAIDDLEALIRRRDYAIIASRAPFRLTVPTRLVEEYGDHLKKMNVADAGISIVSMMKTRLAYKNTEGEAQASLNLLRKVIPAQKTSPVQFSVINNRIVVARQPSKAEADDHKNIAASKDALLDSGKKLIDELKRSNCDRRLLDRINELQSALDSSDNVVALGLMNISCEMIGGAFEKELPDAIRGMLLGQTRGISMYVAQFPDWQRFSESASAVELEAGDIYRISSAAKKIISDLESNPDIADAEVPRTIKAIQELIENPVTATIRSAFAVLRTLENLIAKAFQHGVDLLEKTAVKSVDGLSAAASKVVIAAFLTVTLGGAVEMSPLSSKVAETAWLRKAVEIVRVQIENLEK